MPSAVIGALRVNLGIDTAEFWDGLSGAQRELGKVGQNLKSVGRNLSTYVSAPLAALGGISIKMAGDFEASMNRVGAASGASADQLGVMQKLALDLGKDTSKSASEAADAMEMLAKNGVSTEDIINGAAAASIKLSEATGGDLSTAADVATNVMAQFKLEVKDLGRVVDGITSVTLASQFGFQDYKDAIAQAGGVAGSLGVSIEDFNAAIAATSSVFNSGSDAGTSFKTFLTTLVPKSKSAAAAMEDLGLKFFNADGSMKSMAEVAEELRRGLAGLSDEAKNQAVTDIFGADAMRTAIALADQGADGINKMLEATSKAGVANEQAAARMKGFNGEMEKLSGAFETLAISIASSGLLAFVTDLVSRLADFVSSVGETNPALLNWGVVIAASAAVLGPLAIAAGAVAAGIAAIGVPVAAAIAGIAALTAAGVALYQNWDQVKTNFPVTASVIEKAVGVIQAVTVGLATQLGLVGQYLSQFFSGDLKGAGETVGLIFQNLGTMFTNIANVLFPGAIDAIKTKASELSSHMSMVAQELLNAFLTLPSKMIEVGGQIIDGLVNGIKAKWESVKGTVTGIASGLAESVKSTLGIHSPSRVMHEVGEFVMQGLHNGLVAGTPGAAQAAKTAAQTVSAELGKVGASGMVDPWANLRNATDGATNGLSEMQSAGQSLASTLGNAFTSLIDGSKKFKDVIKDTLSQIGQSFLNSGLQALFGGGGGGGKVSGGLGGLGGIVGNLLGFKDGGSFEVGGTGGIDSQLVAFKASPNERVSITKPGQEQRARGNSYRGGDVVIQGDASENTVRLIRGALRQYDQMAMERQSNTWRGEPT